MAYVFTDNKSRYTIYGVELQSHRNTTVSTSVGNKSWDNFLSNLENNYTYKIGKIPLGYEHRPDLISDLFYNTPGYWWLIMQVNNVIDPFDGLNVGDAIKIPILK